ncbi:acyl-CoA dehydrogenase family protein [Glaciibacter sp. 2TAF33]|uniref:acyl-CoA dehydrogenase family protein n=1 Tax=Glaciibacter sp. 2TAF33 TaxID=3233015 RepID=UPI003F906FE3
MTGGKAKMLDFAEDEKTVQLRKQIRGLIAESIPVDYLGAFTDDPNDHEIAKDFCRLLGENRLFALTWPIEWGGGAAGPWEQTALREEMWAFHEPRGAQYMGLNWIGPVIMRYGTRDQQERFLPPIARGEVDWCQGFSEPGAGSDLPSLRTRATKVDGGWRIDGQKVWTSYAGMASWCVLLARTGTQESRKDGISVFLIEMDQPGIEVRPIPAMIGPHHINEVYFDGAFVKEENLLGELNDGWTIINEVLAFERIGIARYARCERLLAEAPAALGELWHELPDSIVQRWATALMNSRRVKLMAYSVVAAQERGKLDPADASAYRIAGTLLDQEVAEVLMDVVGAWGLGTTDHRMTYIRAVEDHWRYAQAATVSSGTVEMNRIALGRRMVAKK